MGFWDGKSLNDDGVREVVETLIKFDWLHDKEYGIAQLFLSKDRPLSDKQSYVLRTAIESLIPMECQECKGQLEWEDIPQSLEDEEALCSSCRERQEGFNDLLDRIEDL